MDLGVVLYKIPYFHKDVKNDLNPLINNFILLFHKILVFIPLPRDIITDGLGFLGWVSWLKSKYTPFTATQGRRKNFL